jgi:pimeloyl-ACP methyl ester carboxylesterase
MTAKIRFVLLFCLVGGLLFSPTAARSVALSDATTIAFETGVDGQAIGTSLPGLNFSADWVYGDWRSARYNGKYPNGDYVSNGNGFAWLGSGASEGRIDLTEGNALFFEVKVSTATTVTLRGYDGLNALLVSASVNANAATGQLVTLRIDAPDGTQIHHVTLSGAANQWVIDDLRTDAGSLPSPTLPIIILPGVGGSQLMNDPDLNGQYSELWVDPWDLFWSGDDAHLLVTRLQLDGNTPFLPGDPAYYTVRQGDILRSVLTSDVYQSTIQYFKDHGYVEGQTLFVCPYDWRRDLRQISHNSNPNFLLLQTLDSCVNLALARNPDVRKVNLLGHSMGGAVARTYVADPTRAGRVAHLVTLGTPYFGATKIAQMLLAQEGCFLDLPIVGCNPNPATTYQLLQNFPAGYQLSPGERFFDVYPSGYIQRGGVYLNSEQTFDLFRTHNAFLTDEGVAWRAPLNVGWQNGSTNGVEVYMMIGTNLPTITYLEQKPGQESYNTIMANGDGTVPLHSAEMRNLDLVPPVNFSSGATLMFFNEVDHSTLPKNQAVLAAVYAIFSGAKVNFATEQPDSIGPFRQSPRLTGQVLVIEGPVDVWVVDAAGRVTGPADNRINLRQEIPGLYYQQEDVDRLVLKLPDSGTYTLRLQGQRNGQVTVQLLNFVEDKVQGKALYAALPVNTRSTAQLKLGGAWDQLPPFELDLDGDGQFESRSQRPVLSEQ